MNLADLRQRCITHGAYSAQRALQLTPTHGTLAVYLILSRAGEDVLVLREGDRRRYHRTGQFVTRRTP